MYKFISHLYTSNGFIKPKLYKCNFEVFVDRKRNASKLDGGLNILKYFQSKSNFSNRSKYFPSKSGLNVDYVLLVAARWKKN